MDKRERDAHWPSIGFNITASMIESPTGGWRWYLNIHVLGPDDMISWKSEFFEHKKECANHMVINLNKTIQTELNKL